MGHQLERSAAPRGLLGAMWTYSRTTRPQLLASYVGTVVITAAKLSLPLFLGVMINAIQRGGVKALALCYPLFLLMIGVLLFVWLVRVPLKAAQFRVARSAQQNMVEDLHRRLLSAPLQWHEARHSGDTASRVGQSSGAVFTFSMGQFGHIESLVMMIVPLFVLFALSPLISGLTLVGFGLLAALCLGVDRYQRAHWIRESDARRIFDTARVDFFRNIMAIYASRREGSVFQILGDRLENSQAAARTNVLITEVKWSAVDAISTALGLSLLLVYILQRSAQAVGGDIQLGDLFIVQAYVQGGTMALLGVVGNISTVMRQRTDFATAAPILEAPLAGRTGAVLSSDWREITISDLSFTYPSGGGPVAALRDISLRLQRGRHYALVGANGSGKSTLLKLLAGLLEPDAGGYAIDGRQVEPGVLRNSATLAPQNPELLSGTLAENLFLSEADDTGVDKIVSELVELLISPLGVGLSSAVLEAGANWSGGQRQRIALARGLLAAADSSLVLIDEPTSSIDATAERVIISRVREIFKGRCLVAAVHNIELVKDFDEVIILSHGKLSACLSPAVFESTYTHDAKSDVHV